MSRNGYLERVQYYLPRRSAKSARGWAQSGDLRSAYHKRCQCALRISSSAFKLANPFSIRRTQRFAFARSKRHCNCRTGYNTDAGRRHLPATCCRAFTIHCGPRQRPKCAHSGQCSETAQASIKSRQSIDLNRWVDDNSDGVAILFLLVRLRVHWLARAFVGHTASAPLRASRRRFPAAYLVPAVDVDDREVLCDSIPAQRFVCVNA